MLLNEKLLLLTLQNEKMVAMESENVEFKKMLGFLKETPLEILPAKVINKGIHPNLLSVSLNVGKNEGVKVNQPALTANGVIGKVIEVGNHSCIVQLLSDLNYRLSVKILPSGATGILQWLHDNNCEVKEVPKNVNIEIGDPVVTSGFSDIYPGGLPVGKVIAIFDENWQSQKTIHLQINSDLDGLQYLFIITNSD
jgi:rod shape-determining protein MreC